jgi:hypothetical protein
MSKKLRDIIEYAIDEKPVQIKENVDKILREKIKSLVEASKEDVAQSFMAPEAEEETETSDDEESEQPVEEGAFDSGPKYAWSDKQKAEHDKKYKKQGGHAAVAKQGLRKVHLAATGKDIFTKDGSPWKGGKK